MGGPYRGDDRGGPNVPPPSGERELADRPFAEPRRSGRSYMWGLLIDPTYKYKTYTPRYLQTMDSVGYCVRVDAIDGYREKMILLPAVKDYRSIVAVKHMGRTGENPHFHLVLQTDVASQAFRVRMRKVFDQGKGNGHMSIKAWDGNHDAISYLFHEDENTELILQHNVSDETITKCKERNRDVQALVATAKSKASWRLEEVVYQQMLKEGVTREGEVSIASRLLLTALRNGSYAPQAWLIKSMVTRIQFRLLNGDIHDEEVFVDKLARSIYYVHEYT